MMLIQFTLIGIFALNMVLIWLTILTKKLEWYRRLAIFVWLAVLTAMPLFPQPRFYLDFMVWKWAGVAAILLGFGIALWAVFELLKAEVLPQGTPKHLVTSGP